VERRALGKRESRSCGAPAPWCLPARARDATEGMFSPLPPPLPHPPRRRHGAVVDKTSTITPAPPRFAGGTTSMERAAAGARSHSPTTPKAYLRRGAATTPTLLYSSTHQSRSVGTHSVPSFAACLLLQRCSTLLRPRPSVLVATAQAASTAVCAMLLHQRLTLKLPSARTNSTGCRALRRPGIYRSQPSKSFVAAGLSKHVLACAPSLAYPSFLQRRPSRAACLPLPGSSWSSRFCPPSLPPI